MRNKKKTQCDGKMAEEKNRLISKLPQLAKINIENVDQKIKRDELITNIFSITNSEKKPELDNVLSILDDVAELREQVFEIKDVLGFDSIFEKQPTMMHHYQQPNVIQDEMIKVIMGSTFEDDMLEGGGKLIRRGTTKYIELERSDEKQPSAPPNRIEPIKSGQRGRIT